MAVSEKQWFCMTIIFILVIISEASKDEKSSSTTSHRRSLPQIRTKILCSKVICPKHNATDKIHTKCSFLNDCHCESVISKEHTNNGSYSLSISCPKLPSIQLAYDKKSEILMISCQDMTNDFQPFYRELIKKILVTGNYKGLNIRSCFKPGVKWNFHNGCVTGNEHYANVCNASVITEEYSKEYLENLVLSQNCFTEIQGTFSKQHVFLNVLDLSSNLLTFVPNEVFRHLTFLRELSLAKNRISMLTSSSFDGLDLLRKLNLNSNKLTKLPENVFAPVMHLEILDLGNNRLKILFPDVFHHQQHIRHLNLANNSLVTLPVNLFENLTYLSEISVNSNNLIFLPDYLFAGLMQLKLIDLQGNQLKTLPSNFFQSNIGLKELDLSNNYFNLHSLLTMSFKYMAKLDDLQLVNNNITKLTVPLEMFLLYTVYVDMSHNCLTTTTDSDTIIELTSNLESGDNFTFICTDCCLSKIDKKLTTGVIYADFINNRIETIDMEFLNQVSAMEEIDISYNFIRKVDIKWEYPLVDTVEKYQSKTTVRLYHVPLICDCGILPFLELVGNTSLPPKGMQRSKMSFDIYDLYCLEPSHLRLQKLDELLGHKQKIKELVCSTPTSEECPEICTCHRIPSDNITVVDCSARQSPNFPTISNFDHPVQLHLENNGITVLPFLTSAEWSMIHELYLDNNDLEGLGNLFVSCSTQILSLRNNKLKHMPQSVIKAIHLCNTSVLLSGNPWECTCEFLELSEKLLMSNSLLDYNDVKCFLPKSFTSVLLKQARASGLCENPVQKKHLLVIILPVILICVVFLLLGAAVCYRHKEKLKLLVTHSPDSDCFVMDSQ